MIVVNGVSYNSPDDMPPKVRAEYERVTDAFADADGNGTPDIMDALGVSGGTVIQTNTIVYDGKSYASVDDLPPEARELYAAGMSRLADDNRDGVPDVLADPFQGESTVVTTNTYTAGTPPKSALPPPTNLGPIIVLAIVSIGLAIIIIILVLLILNKG